LVAKKNKKAGLIAFEMAQIKHDLVFTREESKFNRPLNWHKRRKQVQSSHKPKKQVQPSSQMSQVKKTSSNLV
jgi:hypothetical protein